MLEKYPIFESLTNEDTFIYGFETIHNVTYIIRFTKANHLFNSVCSSCQNIYEISFTPSNSKPPQDDRVSITIQEIVHIFLMKHECPLVYVCDSLDSREYCRSKLFMKWYKEGDCQDLFKHDSRVLEFNNYSMVIGLIAFKWDDEFEIYLNEIDTDNLS